MLQKVCFTKRNDIFKFQPHKEQSQLLTETPNASLNMRKQKYNHFLNHNQPNHHRAKNVMTTTINQSPIA